jgi:hypothetical protein
MKFIKQITSAMKPMPIEERLKYLTPEQRAKYDENMRRVEEGRAQSQAAWDENQEREVELRVLGGPAGRYLYGAGMDDFGTPDQIEHMMADKGVIGAHRELRAKRKGEFKNAVKQSFNVNPVPQIGDPAQRSCVAGQERAARDAARTPYVSPAAAEVRIDRIATRGETQLAEVLAHVHASGLAPERMFGVYRVPDRISGPLTPHSEKRRVVEWDIVHSPGGGFSAPLVATSFVAEEHWVARRAGEPSVLDEDLALAFCLEAGIGPERCAGLARICEFRALAGSSDGETGGDMVTIVRGIVALHPAEGSGAFERLQAAAPLPLGPPEGVHIEVLNWRAVAAAVHPKINHAPPVPSPFPYLPATPQELLRGYLDIVGVQPADCYSAQATVDRPRALVQGGFLTTNLGPKQPCADGEERMRTRGCEHVVIVYRDRAEYSEGRARWAAYQTEVLEADLSKGLGLRRTIAVPDTGFFSKVDRAAGFVERLHPDHWGNWGREELPPHRYCWPPV